MPCPTCDYLMEVVANELDDEKEFLYWCRRCGTTKTGRGIIQMPRLIERAKRMAEFGPIDEDDPELEEHLELWDRIQADVIEAVGSGG